MHRHDDARTLAPAAQTHIWRLAVKAVRAGLRQTAAAKTYGVSLRAVHKWVTIDKVGGLRALKPKRNKGLTSCNMIWSWSSIVHGSSAPH